MRSGRAGREGGGIFLPAGELDARGLDDDFLGHVEAGIVIAAEGGHVVVEKGDGFGAAHFVLGVEKLEALAVVAEIDADFSEGEELDEDAEDVGVRVAEFENVFVDFRGEGGVGDGAGLADARFEKRGYIADNDLLRGLRGLDLGGFR